MNNSNNNNAASTAQTTYPDRYYAQYDPQASQPTPVIGWYDMWAYSSLNGLPPLTELLPLTVDFWENHISQPQTPRAVENGRIVDYTPPVVPIPLKEQAQSAFQSARQQFSDLQMMGQTFGPQQQKYMQALNAIITGKDTTSTALPTAPADPTT